jgi:MSHA biogenesis protein MshI
MQISQPFKGLLSIFLRRSGPSNQEWTAVDLDGAVTAIRVKKPLKPLDRPIVTGFYHEKKLASSETSLQGMLQALGGQKGVSPSFCLILCRGDYQVFLMDKPAVRTEEVDQSLRWALTPLLDYPAAEANLSFIEIPTADPGAGVSQKIYLVACKRSHAERQASFFARSKINLLALDIRQTSHRNIAHQIGADKFGVCLIVPEQLGIQITISFNGDLYLERFLRESILFESGRADLGQSIDSSAFDRIANEVQRSLDFVTRSYPSLSSIQIFVGPTPFDIQLSQQLSSRLAQPVQNVDLSMIFEWASGSELAKPEVQAACFHALGAALRD